jgi:gas vesicle protein
LNLIVPHIEQRLAPYQNYITQREYDRVKSGFIESNKDLEPYMDVAEEVASRQLNSGKQYKDVKEFYEDVATQTKEVIKKWQARVQPAPLKVLDDPPPASSTPKVRSVAKSGGTSLTQEQADMKAFVEAD